MKQNRDPQNNITGAIILIFIGLIFLTRKLGILEIQNWWALFILIPAISSLVSLIFDVQRGSNLLRVIGEGVFGAIFPSAIAFMFLFNLSWLKYWPIFVILAGFSMILTALIPTENNIESFLISIRPWIISWGLGVSLTGSLFLIQSMQILDPSRFITNWWGIPIILAASGGVFAALLPKQNQSKLGMILNLTAALILSIPGIFALLGFQTNFVLPVLIITIGLVLIISFVNNKS